MILKVIMLGGTLYGIDYFKLYKRYGVLNNSLPLGIYILSFKWWNIKFNWYTIRDKQYVGISIILPVNMIKRYFREYIVTITSTGVKTCTVNINYR